MKERIYGETGGKYYSLMNYFGEKNEGRDSEWRKDYEEEEDEELVVRNQ